MQIMLQLLQFHGECKTMWCDLPLGRGKTYLNASVLNYDATFMENRQCWYHKNVMSTINIEHHTANHKLLVPSKCKKIKSVDLFMEGIKST